MAPKYKAYYFDFPALGEPMRYLLSYANMDFEDIRYSFEEWKDHKAEMPLKQVPVLEFDGKKFSQSGATCRYIAKQCGLVGKTDEEDLQIDMAVDTFTDFRLPIVLWSFDTNAESKKAKYEPLINEHLPLYLGYYEDLAKKNGGYLVGGRLTWADFYFIAPLDYYREKVQFDFLDKYPSLKKLEQKIRSIPQIASYLKKHPAYFKPNKDN